MDNVVRGGNCYVDTLNLWRVLDEMEVPEIKHAEDKFVPGGHMIGLSMQEEVEALTGRIKTKTTDPELQGLIGRQPGDYTTFTWYENLRSYRTGQTRGRVIVMKGLMTGSKQPVVKGMKAPGRDYTLSNIVFYHDVVDGKSIHRFDFFAGPGATLINGIAAYQAMATNLAIAGGTVL